MDTFAEIANGAAVRAREFELFIAKEAGLPPSEVDHRMRSLRDRGLIPTGGRGPHAPKIDETHMAMMLLNLVSRRAADADEIGAMAEGLMFRPGDNGRGLFGESPPKPRALHELLVYLLRYPESAKRCRFVEIACDGRQAFCAERLRGMSLEEYDFRSKGSKTARSIGQSFIIRGSFFEKAAALLHEKKSAREGGGM